MKVGDLLATGDEISTGAGATIDVLWDHRALLSLHEESRLHIQELHHGQTECVFIGEPRGSPCPIMRGE